MSRFESPLDNIRIASPCSADWDEMFGNERKRFCGQCSLNVYNLSGMTRDEAENLLMASEGRVCVRYYERADGTLLTRDCPVGWAKLKQRFSIAATAVFSLMMTVFTGLFFVSMFSKVGGKERRFPIPFARPTPAPLMGAVSVSPARPSKAQPRKETDLDELRKKVLKQAGV